MKIEINVKDHTFTVQWDDQQCNKYTVPEGMRGDVVVQKIADFFSETYLKNYVGDGPVVRSTGDAEAGFNLRGKWVEAGVRVEFDGGRSLYIAYDMHKQETVGRYSTFVGLREGVEEWLNPGAGGLQYKSSNLIHMLKSRGFTLSYANDMFEVRDRNMWIIVCDGDMDAAISRAIWS